MLENRTIKKYYPFLDTFRALAALWVCIYHINIFFDLRDVLKGLYPIFFKFASIGELGVDVFFVMSGYLISGLLYPEFEGNLQIRRFYGRRFFKIIPQYLVATAVGLYIGHLIEPFIVVYTGLDYFDASYNVASITSHPSNPNILSHFFLYQNFTTAVGILSHTWSLAIEEHFYFIFPLLLVVITKISPNVRTRKRILLTILCLLLLLPLVLKIYFVQVKHLFPIFIAANRYDAIIFGCLLKLFEPKFESIPLDRWRTYSGLFIVLGFGIFVCLAQFGFVRYSIFGYPSAYLAAGLLILAFMREEYPGGWLRRAVNNKWMVSIGRASYGIYLWHYILIYCFHQFEPALGTAPTVVLYLAATIAVGYASTYSIEKYFLKVRARLIP